MFGRHACAHRASGQLSPAQWTQLPVLSVPRVLRQSLLPEKRMLFQPNLAKAAGSDYIAKRVEELRPIAHVFGALQRQSPVTKE